MVADAVEVTGVNVGVAEVDAVVSLEASPKDGSFTQHRRLSCIPWPLFPDGSLQDEKFMAVTVCPGGQKPPIPTWEVKLVLEMQAEAISLQAVLGTVAGAPAAAAAVAVFSDVSNCTQMP